MRVIFFRRVTSITFSQQIIGDRLLLVLIWTSSLKLLFCPPVRTSLTNLLFMICFENIVKILWHSISLYFFLEISALLVFKVQSYFHFDYLCFKIFHFDHSYLIVFLLLKNKIFNYVFVLVMSSIFINNLTIKCLFMFNYFIKY